MIPRMYWVYDDDLDAYHHTTDYDEAVEYAQGKAHDNGMTFAVMLLVPGPQSFPELRCVAVIDETGRKVWETDVYDSELATA